MALGPFTGGERHDLGNTGLHRSEDGRRDQLVPGRLRARRGRSLLARWRPFRTGSPSFGRWPSGGLSLLWGSDSVDPGPGLGRRRRLPAVELRLSELPRRPGRLHRRVATQAGIRGGERQRPELDPAERLSRDPRADRKLRSPSSAVPASLPYPRHRADQRRSRPHLGPSLSARVTPTGRVCHRARPEDNVGLRIREVSTGRRLAYFPAVGGLTPIVDKALADADAVFFDGTFWSADELPSQGLGVKRASDMAHLPVGGEDGSLRTLRGLRVPRRIYIHVNNTNPVLREDSVERRQAQDAGWEIAWDGMEVTL